MTAHDMPTCGNPLPCKWAVRYAALERDHLKKWEQIDALQRENAALREALESSRRTHLDVDGDPWFSCPKSEDRGGSCLRHDMGTTPCPCGCTCGADEHNARIDAVLARSEAQEAQAS